MEVIHLRILGGVSYDGAVESSIRSATDRGYGLVLVPDACATCDESQQADLWRMESGIIQVMPVARVVAHIGELGMRERC